MTRAATSIAPPPQFFTCVEAGKWGQKNFRFYSHSSPSDNDESLTVVSGRPSSVTNAFACYETRSSFCQLLALDSRPLLEPHVHQKGDLKGR